jgi:hypothetical protein
MVRGQYVSLRSALISATADTGIRAAGVTRRTAGRMYQSYPEGIDDDFVLTNASIYWLTETIAPSARIYYEQA